MKGGERRCCGNSVRHRTAGIQNCAISDTVETQRKAKNENRWVARPHHHPATSGRPAAVDCRPVVINRHRNRDRNRRSCRGRHGLQRSAALEREGEELRQHRRQRRQSLARRQWKREQRPQSVAEWQARQRLSERTYLRAVRGDEGRDAVEAGCAELVAACPLGGGREMGGLAVV